MANSNRSITSLFIEFAEQVTLLIRQEATLITTEISEKFHQLGVGLTSVIIGGLMAFCGLLVLLAAAVLGLAQWVAPWLSALIIGVIVLLIGGIFLISGRNALKPESLALKRTTNTLKMQKDLIKEQLSHESRE